VWPTAVPYCSFDKGRGNGGMGKGKSKGKKGKGKKKKNGVFDPVNKAKRSSKKTTQTRKQCKQKDHKKKPSRLFIGLRFMSIYERYGTNKKIVGEMQTAQD
jgi:hypothetical protein